MEVEYVHIWLLDLERRTLTRYDESARVSTLSTSPECITHLIAHPAPMHAAAPEAADYHAVLDTEASQPVTAWAPLVERGQAVGVLGLGPRWTGEVYDAQDLELIGILARQMALSILNTRQWERIQQMSHALAQAEENERRKIARELHDTVLQFLLVLTYGLDGLKEQCVASVDEIEQGKQAHFGSFGEALAHKKAVSRSDVGQIRANHRIHQNQPKSTIRLEEDYSENQTLLRIRADLAGRARIGVGRNRAPIVSRRGDWLYHLTGRGSSSIGGYRYTCCL